MFTEEPYFDYLTAVIKVPASAPKSWQEEGLTEFYRNPNDATWGASLCRILLHESFHYWQLFSSGYAANLVAEDWRRLVHYEKTGEVPPPRKDPLRTTAGSGERPFTAHALLECWARFWDVHSRGPQNVIVDEGHPPSDVAKLRITDPATAVEAYTSAAYDYLMTSARGNGQYEVPYQWLLSTMQGHSFFVAALFPPIAHCAFGSPDPVGVFCEAFDRAWNSRILRNVIDHARYRNINYQWLNVWGTAIDEACLPTLSDHGLPDFTSGLDAITRGPLASHPIYSESVGRFRALSLHLRHSRNLHARGPVPKDAAKRYAYRMAALPAHDPWVVFGLPGQPDYRTYLGWVFDPARVEFSNYALEGRRPAWLETSDSDESDADGSYGSIVERLTSRVENYRQAKYAADVGLAPGEFD